MLIRFRVENFLSFGESQEFLTIANRKILRMSNHCFKHKNIGILKFTSIYGANGAGKSNLAKAINYIDRIVMNGLPKNAASTFSKCHQISDLSTSGQQSFLIEFLQDNTVYVYELKIKEDRISEESLLISGLNEGEDELVFARTTNRSGISEIHFSDELQSLEKESGLLGTIEKNILEPNKTVLETISKLKNNQTFEKIISAYNWFELILDVVYPRSIAAGLSRLILENEDFKIFANEAIAKLGLGVKRFELNEVPIDELEREGHQIPSDLFNNLTSEEFRIARDRDNNGFELLYGKSGDKKYIKRLEFYHEYNGNENIHRFQMNEESDGTLRVFHLLPTIYGLINFGTVVIIDEIERSIHPNLIKALLTWLTERGDIKGQLIFTTHDTGLLDNELFRQDEIWFSEKDSIGNSKIYSLNDFKEHHTLDFRKGYLSGRYGSIPYISEIKFRELCNA